MRSFLLVAALLLASTPTTPDPVTKPKVAAVKDAGVQAEAPPVPPGAPDAKNVITERRLQMLKAAKMYVEKGGATLVGVYFVTAPTPETDGAVVIMDDNGSIVMNVFFYVQKRDKSGYAWTVMPFDFVSVDLKPQESESL